METSRKKIMYVDMDNVIADFTHSDPRILKRGYGAHPEMYSPGFFLNLPVVPGAHEAMRTLFNSQKFDMWILSQPVADSALSYSEKAQWIMMHFPYLSDKIILTQNKLLNTGDYLIDDSEKWVKGFEGKSFLFDYNTPRSSWNVVLKYFGIELIHE